MRSRSGRKLPSGTTILRGSTSTAINQLRCPNCRGLAVPIAQNSTGKGLLYNCNKCGAKFGAKTL